MAFMMTNQARIFIAPAGAGCGKVYSYYNCMKLGGLDRSAGEATPVFCPDETHAGRFRQVQVIKGADGAWTSSIVGYKPVALPSILSRLARARCKFDLQVHFGTCNDPSNFSDYDMAIVFENVEISSYDIDGVGALQGSEVAPIMETVNITAGNVYELFTVDLVNAASVQAALGAQIVSVTYNPYNCVEGDAEVCQTFYALQTPPDYVTTNETMFIVVSNDRGLTWTQHATDIPASVPGEELDALSIAVGNDYIVVVNDATGLLYSIPVASLINNPATYTATYAIDGMVTRLKRIRSRVYGVTANGKIFWTRPATLSTYFLEDGSLYTNRWNDIDGIDYDNLLVGGENGTLLLQRNGRSLRTVVVSISGAPLAEDITAVVMKSSSAWVIGTADGNVYCTNDAGVTWALLFTYPGSIIRRVVFPTNSVGYIVLKNPAIVYSTADGGAQWSQIQAPTTGFSTYSVMADFVACTQDPTIFVGVGFTPDDVDVFAASESAIFYPNIIGSLDGFVVIGD